MLCSSPVKRRPGGGPSPELSPALAEIRQHPRRGSVRQHGIHSDTGSCGHLSQSTGQRDLGGLGDAVVDHLHRNVQVGLARDEDNAAPIPLQHPRQVEPAQANAAQNVNLEEPQPILIRDLGKRLGLKNAETIHQYVDLTP